MREIKFRVWDKKDNLWLAGWNIGQSGITSEYGNKVVMQFTGLKDKNGVEIYEGDILHHKGVNYAVEWLGYKWTIRNGKGTTHPFRQIYTWPMNFEIIGNIYENPELLK